MPKRIPVPSIPLRPGPSIGTTPYRQNHRRMTRLPLEVDLPPDINEALQEVDPLEPGDVLHDNYTFEEYCKRRATFLGNHLSHRKLNISQIAQNDSEAVFGTAIDPALLAGMSLSVEEVRRRELMRGLRPLLPLPTTGNTETLDNFASYGDVEWSVALARGGGHLPPSACSTAAPTTMATPLNLAQSSYLDQPFADQTAGAGDHFVRITPKPKSAHINSSSAIPSANPTNMSNGLQQISPHGNSHRSSTAQVTTASQFIASAKMSNQAISVDANVPAYDTALIKAIIDRLGTGNGYNQATRARADSSVNPATSTTPQIVPSKTTSNIEIRHPISALASRGFHLPIKLPPGKKRAGTPEDEHASSTQSEVASAEDQKHSSPVTSTPARKTLIVKLKVPLEAMEETYNTQTPATRPPANMATSTVKSAISNMSKKKATRKSIEKTTSEQITGEKSTEKATKMATEKKVVPKKKNTAPGPKILGGLGKAKDAVNHFEYVIAGTALPTCAEEARNASVERLNRLQNEESRPRKKSSHKGQQPSLNFPPEFFDNTNLTEDVDNGEVHCVCDSDDGDKTICCDNCFVWQHLACMGAAVPKNKQKGLYLCQMCDPWAHRELLAKLRSEQA